MQIFKNFFRSLSGWKWRFCYEKSWNIFLRTCTWNLFIYFLKFWLMHSITTCWYYYTLVPRPPWHPKFLSDAQLDTWRKISWRFQLNPSSRLGGVVRTRFFKQRDGRTDWRTGGFYRRKRILLCFFKKKW